MATQEADKLNNEIEDLDKLNLDTDENQSENNNEESDEIVITIEGESLPPEDEVDETKAPEWVKELRKNHRELVKRNRELEDEIQKVKPKEPDLKLSEKPTLAGCDYDADEFEQKLETWHKEKIEFDAKQKQIEEAKKADSEAWQNKLNGYAKAKSELKVKDFDDAEEMVKSQLSVTQQGIIIDTVSDPAILIYAMGKNPKLLKELSEIKNPAQFSFALGKLEGKLKVSERKAPPPMKDVSGSGGNSGGAVDSTLEQLRAEAEKTGDYTKVTRYKSEQRAKLKS